MVLNLLRVTLRFNLTIRAFQNQSRTEETATTTNSLNEEILVEERNNYAIVRLNRPPVNTLTARFLNELSRELDRIERSRSINGVVFTSNLPNVFCAGVDINQLYPFDAAKCASFWSACQELWMRLYGSSKVYIAAINGHSIGAGCLLPMSCDYRLMSTGQFKIGANETVMGLQAAFWLRDSMLRIIGHRETERAIQLGILFTPEEALQVKLIDEICKSEELLAKAEERMKMWLKIPTAARELTKTSMRRETLNKLMPKRQADIDSFVEFLSKDYIQNALKIYFEELKSRKKKPLKS